MSQSGFTLVELLLVVAVLGLLGMVAVVAVPHLAEEAQVQSCAADREALRTAQSAYAIQHGAPASEAQLVSEGLLSAPSGLHDVVVAGGTYELVGVEGCAGDPDESVLTRWVGLQQSGAFRFGADGQVSVSGSGERQAIAVGEPFSSGVIELRAARTTKGDGWGAVFHAEDKGGSQIRGYVFQMDTGYSGGRFVLRQPTGASPGRWPSPHPAPASTGASRTTSVWRSTGTPSVRWSMGWR